MNGEEDTCFYLKSFHVFISNSANKGTFFLQSCDIVVCVTLKLHPRFIQT